MLNQNLNIKKIILNFILKAQVKSRKKVKILVNLPVHSLRVIVILKTAKNNLKIKGYPAQAQDLVIILTPNLKAQNLNPYPNSKYFL